MKIYRDNGFVVIENVLTYDIGELTAELVDNRIKIHRIGVDKNEVIVPYYEIKDEFGIQVAENAADALTYVLTVISGNQASEAKSITISFEPPASPYYKKTVIDLDSIEGSSYDFQPLENDGEIEWNAFICSAFSKIDGEITLYIHAPTGLFVGDYDFEYKQR